MHKYIIAILAVAFVSFSLSAKEMTKEEKKRIKDQLKIYKKDPESYQRMLGKYQAQIDTANTELGRKRDENDNLIKTATEQQAKMSMVESQLKTLQNKPEVKCPDCPVAGAVPSHGTIYKVQLGLYSKLNINNYFDKPKYIGVEQAEKMNRYVVSYFETKEEAENFVKDMKRFGIKGAFASKYENGERVYEWEKNPKFKGKKAPKSLQEALGKPAEPASKPKATVAKSKKKELR